jgi:hypothetical protein
MGAPDWRKTKFPGLVESADDPNNQKDDEEYFQMQPQAL